MNFALFDKYILNGSEPFVNLSVDSTRLEKYSPSPYMPYDAEVENEGMYRVIDDSGEDYLYSKVNPAPLDGSSPGGRWEIVEK